jgi:hypothetical protein
MSRLLLRGRRALGVGLLALGGASGCLADVDSDAIRTRGLHGRFVATSYGDNVVTVRGTLRVGGALGSVAELRGEDELWAYVDGKERRMGGGDGSYSAQFESDGDGKEVVVAFRRGPDDEGAPDSTVTLPKAFELSLEGLEPGDDLVRGNALVLRWSPGNPGGSLSYSVQGTCIVSFAALTSDDGEHVVTAGDIEHYLAGKSCDVVVELMRETHGRADPNFEEGGTFVAYQVRRANFTSLPAPNERPGAGDRPPG